MLILFFISLKLIILSCLFLNPICITYLFYVLLYPVCSSKRGAPSLPSISRCFIKPSLVEVFNTVRYLNSFARNAFNCIPAGTDYEEILYAFPAHNTQGWGEFILMGLLFVLAHHLPFLNYLFLHFST